MKKKIFKCDCKGHKEVISPNDCICSPDDAGDIKSCMASGATDTTRGIFKKGALRNKMKIKKFYTVSTYIFDSLKEAEEQIQEWNDEKTLNEGTMVLEITGIIYRPKIKLIKDEENY